MAVAFACLAIFPLAQMFFFGKTDYRRPADAAVVLGARVYADGRLSDALADRVRTACQLYRDGSGPEADLLRRARRRCNPRDRRDETDGHATRREGGGHLAGQGGVEHASDGEEHRAPFWLSGTPRASS